MILEATTENIGYCAHLLENDDIIGIPTETVYGLGGNAFSESSVRKIFQTKGRPLIDPLIVHCKDLETILSITVPNQHLKLLSNAFWPGPLTLIIPKNQKVPDLVTAGLPSVAVRIPQHPVFLHLLKIVDFPLAAPSANPFGYVSPTTARHVQNTLGNKIKAILDGGASNIGLESTILDLRNPQKPMILRPGPITAIQIEKVLELSVATSKIGKKNKDGTAQSSPGQLTKHYSPKTSVGLLKNGSVQSANVLSQFDDSTALICNQKPGWYVNQPRIYWLSETGSLDEIARNFFNLLQKLDDKKFKQIYIEVAPSEGIGLAINDRLTRAAAQSEKR